MCLDDWTTKRRGWVEKSQVLAQVCVTFERVCKSLVYETRFSDLKWQCKSLIFMKVVEGLKFSEDSRGESQRENCKKLVRCKTLSRSWKYWITRMTYGVEMLENIVFLDW